MAQLTTMWPQVSLGQICEINPRRPSNLERAENEPTTFVPMESVDDLSGKICWPKRRTFTEIKRGYTFFAENDVLFAKITPCMQNGKHAIARDLINGIGFGTTEFHVVRPNDKIIAEWIHYFLRQPSTLNTAEAAFTGSAGQQRVPKEFLENLEIPLPPLAEQQRIVAILNERLAAVERARKAAAAQLVAAQALPAAYLREVFESEQAARWPKMRLEDVLIQRREMIHPRDNPKGPATFVGLEHIESQTGRRIGSLAVEMAELTGRKPRFYQGDIVYGYLRPYLNKVWLAEFDGLCSVDQYIYTVDEDIADKEFIIWFMRSSTYLKRAPIGLTPGQLPRIRTEEVGAVEINLPDIATQKTVIQRLQKKLGHTFQMITAVNSQIDAIAKMPAALLRQAFNGEL
ncbi:MAG: restriction endonuclease subunit S [Caldilineaceae bacterium]